MLEVFVQKRLLFIHTPGLERSQHQSIPPLHVFKELQCQGPLGATHSADGAIKGDGIAPDRVQACTTSADSLAAVLQLFLSNFGLEALGRGHTGIIIRKSKILVSKEPVSYHRILHDPKVLKDPWHVSRLLNISCCITCSAAAAGCSQHPRYESGKLGRAKTDNADWHVFSFFFTHKKSGLEQFQRFLPALCQCTSADGGVDANGILSPCVAMMAMMTIMGRGELTWWSFNKGIHTPWN